MPSMGEYAAMKAIARNAIIETNYNNTEGGGDDPAPDHRTMVSHKAFHKTGNDIHACSSISCVFMCSDYTCLLSMSSERCFSVSSQDVHP